MNALSLNPRFDLFRIELPKELVPEEIHEKWYNLLNKNDKQVFREPIDIINESIQSIEITGISEGATTQDSPARNTETGRIESVHPRNYRSSENPLKLMNNEITITFRHIQGFYNYFLLFESWFYHHSKKEMEDFTPFFIIEILDESGQVINHLKLFYPVFNSIDSLNLSYNRAERSSETFNCTFTYSDIDFDFGEPRIAND